MQSSNPVNNALTITMRCLTCLVGSNALGSGLKLMVIHELVTPNTARFIALAIVVLVMVFWRSWYESAKLRQNNPTNQSPVYGWQWRAWSNPYELLQWETATVLAAIFLGLGRGVS